MPNPAAIESNPANSFMIAAYGMYEVFSTITSSPQTTEINANVRAHTLMKWVNLGILQAFGFAAIGMIIAKQEGYAAWPIGLGTIIAGTLVYSQYVYAKNSGLKNLGPPTETYLTNL